MLLRFLRADNGGRLEVTCDAVADWLPVRLRGGTVRQGEWKVWVDLSSEWRKLSGVWYPAHQVKTSYIGTDMTPVKEIDLTVENLRANGAVNIPDSIFSLSAMAIPDGTHGLDRRKEPFRRLFKAGGVVRDQRPGEGPSMRNADQERVELEKDEETMPAEESGGAGNGPPGGKGHRCQPGVSFLAGGICPPAPGPRESFPRGEVGAKSAGDVPVTGPVGLGLCTSVPRAGARVPR